jgi:outer membrane protein assembly factor BamC
MNSALKWMPLAAGIALATAGCARDGYYDDRNLDYGEAQRSAPLDLPETRNPARYRDAMPVPEATGEFRGDGSGFEAPVPQPLSAGRAKQDDFVERREIGGEAWLVVVADPASVWPQLEDFVRTRGLSVVESDSSRGVIVTPQARLTLQPGLRADSSEVRCEQNGRPVEQCLQELEQYFSSRSASASASSLAAQRLAGEERIHLEQQGDDWRVQIPVEIDRAWAELHHQLRLDFTAEERRELLDSNPVAHEFLINYLVESQRDRGLLQTVLNPGARQAAQRIRLVMEPAGPDRTLLRAVNASDQEFTPADQRELLERVASLLR